MKLLLDTHLLIWSSFRSWLLPKAASELITDPANEVIFSSISIWEVAIKRGLGREDFDVEPRVLRRGLVEHGFSELGFTSEHAFAVQDLPHIHGDPFDRALVAQAISEGYTLLTTDSALGSYPASVRRV